ncbi:MAG TPA: L,D-transpeptidase family protein [Chthoniobacterales bacterium]
MTAPFPSSIRFYSLLAACLLILPGCGILKDYQAYQANRAELKAFKAMRKTWAAEHAAFRSQPGWKKRTYKNEALLKMASPENVRLEIALSEQRGLLLVSDSVAMDFAVATGKRSHPTPAGSFAILSKSREYASNLYGKIYDATGVVTVADADTTRDTIPEGGWFEGASMPYWMRLTNTGVGLHIGYVPGRPASHGCIRLPSAVAPVIFQRVRVGTPVVIADTAPALGSGRN